MTFSCKEDTMRKLSGLCITLVLSLAVFFNGCGGGGSSTSRGGGNDATLTSANASQVGNAVTQAVKLVAPATALGKVKGASLSPGRKAPLISIFEKVVPVVRNQAANEKTPSALRTESCPDGGNIEVTSLTPDGLSGKVKADVNVNGCKIGEETMNGVLEVTVPLDAIDDLAHVKEFTVEVSRFTYTDPHSSISLTDNFTMIADNITYNGDSLKSGSLILGGTAVGTIDGEAISIGCDSFGLSFSVDPAGGISVWVSGRINATCLGGWVTLATNQPFYLQAHASCPTGGDMVASSGGNSVSVLIATDSKITVSFNGTVIQTFNNCSEVTGICKG